MLPIDPDTCLPLPTKDAWKPGVFMGDDAQQDCCCTQDWAWKSRPAACQNQACAPTPSVGPYPHSCQGLSGRDLQECCRSWDFTRGGRVPQGEDDNDPYPAVCTGVNANFQPNLPQQQPGADDPPVPWTPAPTPAPTPTPTPSVSRQHHRRNSSAERRGWRPPKHPRMKPGGFSFE